MTRYIIKRILLALVALLGVSIFVFVASRLSGDVVYLLLGDSATPEEVARLHHELGLDKPIPVQFVLFLWHLVQGDFGESIRYQRPVLQLIGERLPATLELSLSGFVMAQVIGIMLGIAAARRRGSWVDSSIRAFAVLGQSMPNFWLGIMAIIVFAVKLGWLPTSGRNGLSSLVMPMCTLAVFSLASIMRITRSAMLETMDSEYVRFLRAKGMGEGKIIWKHVLRNALIPVTALAGIQLGFLLGGTVIVETVFAWPGIGSLMVEAITSRDYPLIQAGAMLTSSILVTLNLVVDLLFGVIDPRVRYA